MQTFLRLQQMFPQVDPWSGASMPDNTPSPDMNDNLMSSYQPRTDISNQYQETLKNPPVRQPASKLRQVGAAISAGLTGMDDPAAGIGIGQMVNDYPNIKAQGDYTTRLKELGAGAAEEDKYNINQRQLAMGTESANLKQREADIKQQRADMLDEKNRNIYDTKMADLQARVDKADKDRELATQRLEADRYNRDMINNLHNAELAALNARHALDIAQKEAERKALQPIRDSLAASHERSNQPTVTTEKVNTTGTERVTTKQPLEMKVRMVGPPTPAFPSGQEFNVAVSKVEQAKKDGLRVK